MDCSVRSRKTYLEQQIENRDNIIAELREWITQLEAGKVYLETN